MSEITMYEADRPWVLGVVLAALAASLLTFFVVMTEVRHIRRSLAAIVQQHQTITEN